MLFYHVRNWERFQHYKDRNPPWIKLHFEILTSTDWVCLNDASRVLAIACMLIASRNEGRVPADPHYLKRVAYLNKLPNLKPLLNCGFLEILQADASVLQADARPETETYSKEEEKERKKDSLSENDLFESFWEIYPKTRRGNKSKAQSAWKNALTRASQEKIYDAAKNYAASDEVARGYAKGAAAWLNDDRWDVDYKTGSGIVSTGSGNDARPLDKNSRANNEQPRSKWEVACERVIGKIERGEM